MANCVCLLVMLLIVLPGDSSTATVGQGGTSGRGGTIGRGATSGRGGGGYSGGGGWAGIFGGFLSGSIFGSARAAPPRINWGSGNYWDGKIPSAHMAAVNPKSESSESDWHVVPVPEED